jgi:large-conductance mechanosensitive channel
MIEEFREFLVRGNLVDLAVPSCRARRSERS